MQCQFDLAKVLKVAEHQQPVKIPTMDQMHGWTGLIFSRVTTMSQLIMDQ